MPAKGSYKYSLKDCQRYAKSRGGTCLSNFYVSRRESKKLGKRLKWKCSAGHVWEADFDNMSQRGSWCYLCSRKKLAELFRHDIKEVRKLARAKGGRFLSPSYTSALKPYLWECKNGHRWKTAVSNVRNANSWCPYCVKGSGEECVRICFEKVFRRNFPKVRPAWLKGISGRLLELDGFNSQMGLAFEHQGRHHYRPINFFYRKDGLFQRRIAIDRKKSGLCRQYGVRLVKVPEVGWRFPLERLLPEVIRRCRSQGIRVPAGADRLRIDYSPAWNANQHRSNERIRQLKAYARKRGGRCLDSKWIGYKAKYRFRCKRGHLWKTQPGGMLGRERDWCRRCSRFALREKSKRYWKTRGLEILRRKWKVQGRIKQLQAVAKSRGGECLSKEWAGWQAEYRFWCKRCNQKWKAYPQGIFEGGFCKKCAMRTWWKKNRTKQSAKFLARNRHLLTKLKMIARAKGGKCLSRKWEGVLKSYQFECGKCGRVWQTRPGKIFTGRWCLSCALRRRHAANRAKRRPPATA